MERSERLMSLFQSLLLTEKRVDEAIAQKKMIVEEAHFKKIKKPSTIRINILAERSTEGSLFLLIGGKIREEQESEEEKPAKMRPLGSVLKKMFVDMDAAGSVDRPIDCLYIEKAASTGEEGGERASIPQAEDSCFFEWYNTSSECKVSEFEIKTCAQAKKARLYLSLISYTGIYMLCAPLSAAVGIKAGSRPVILLSIWRYIVAQKMKDPKNPKIVICNEVFQHLFGKKEVSFGEIIRRLDEYISPLEMITVDFDLPVEAGAKTQSAYDITVELDPVAKEYAYSDVQKLSVLNKKVGDILVRVEKQNEKIELLKSFAADPKEFIVRWIAEESKNLHLIADDLYEVSDGFYAQKEIQESVYQLLQNYK